MQFRLRALLAVVLCISVLCALLFAVPDRIALLILLVISLHAPIAALLGIVYFDGDARAFSIGATSGIVNTLLLSTLYSTSMALEEVTALLQGVISVDAIGDVDLGKFMFVCILGAYLSGGVLGVVARRL
jgi:hypothetical protein